MDINFYPSKTIVSNIKSTMFDSVPSKNKVEAIYFFYTCLRSMSKPDIIKKTGSGNLRFSVIYTNTTSIAIER